MTTNIKIKNAKPEAKDYTISIDFGSFLLVKTTGDFYTKTTQTI